jgi:hypothetical protein
MLALGNLSLDEFTQKQKEYELKTRLRMTAMTMPMI